MRSFVIYTVVVGNYDEVKQPIVIDDRFDYVLFSDSIQEDSVGIWQVRRIPYVGEDFFKLSRYPKVLPHVVLNNYKASLYIDGTLQIASNFVYERFVNLFNDGVEWGGIKHYYRDCIYDEICGIVTFPQKATHDYECINWYSRLKKEGYPEHLGLYENNVIFRIHNERVNHIDEMWWKSLQRLCRRDQFSLMYFFWKYPIKRIFFLPPNEDAKHSKHFVYTTHSLERKNVRLGFHEKVRRKCWSYSPFCDSWYGYILEHVYKNPIAVFALPAWEVYALFRYAIPSILKQAIRHI